jgi:hypothetical protein
VLQVANHTPFACGLSLLPDRDGIDSVYAAIKGTFAIRPVVAIADEQVPVFAAPQHHDDPKSSSVRYPSDVGLPKRATDVLVVGHAWGPNGRPTTRTDVSVTVGPVQRDAAVFGDRVWQGNGVSYAMSHPEPFSRMPLVWERAFGGVDHVDEAEVFDPRNPVGTGYRHAKGVDPIDGAPVANVEDRGTLISSPHQSPPPAGFGAIGEHWLPRRRYGGTYDAAWQANRAPYLPDDFDERFLQVAPEGLIAPGHLVGGEPVELIGMSPEGVLRFVLPTVALDVAFVLDGSPQPAPVTLDTVILEPDAPRFSLVWRAALQCDKRALKVSECRVALRSLS